MFREEVKNNMISTTNLTSAPQSADPASAPGQSERAAGNGAFAEALAGAHTVLDNNPNEHAVENRSEHAELRSANSDGRNEHADKVNSDDATESGDDSSSAPAQEVTGAEEGQPTSTGSDDTTDTPTPESDEPTPTQPAVVLNAAVPTATAFAQLATAELAAGAAEEPVVATPAAGTAVPVEGSTETDAAPPVTTPVTTTTTEATPEGAEVEVSTTATNQKSSTPGNGDTKTGPLPTAGTQTDTETTSTAPTTTTVAATDAESNAVLKPTGSQNGNAANAIPDNKGTQKAAEHAADTGAVKLANVTVVDEATTAETDAAAATTEDTDEVHGKSQSAHDTHGNKDQKDHKDPKDPGSARSERALEVSNSRLLRDVATTTSDAADSATDAATAVTDAATDTAQANADTDAAAVTAATTETNSKSNNGQGNAATTQSVNSAATPGANASQTAVEHANANSAVASANGGAEAEVQANANNSQGASSVTHRASALDTPAMPTMTQERVDHIANQLSARLKLSQAAGGSFVQLSLRPRELGDVEVSLAVQNGAVTAHVIVEKTETAGLLRAHLEELRRSLNERGVSVEHFSVDVQDGKSQGELDRGLAQAFGHLNQNNGSGSNTGEASSSADDAALDALDGNGTTAVTPEEVHDGNVSVLV